MIILCPKCKVKNLKTSERSFVSRSVLNPDRLLYGADVVTTNKEINVRICTCPCGFDGYTMEVDIINLISNQKKIS